LISFFLKYWKIVIAPFEQKGKSRKFAHIVPVGYHEVCMPFSNAADKC